MNPPSAPGFVDPGDHDQVAAVFAQVLRAWGTDGVVDLLTRLPGVDLVPGTPRRRLRSPVPAMVAIGAADRLLLSEPPEHQHVVGGVVLARTSLPPGRLPALLAEVVVELTRIQGSQADTAAALSAVREVLDRA